MLYQLVKKNRLCIWDILRVSLAFKYYRVKRLSREIDQTLVRTLADVKKKKKKNFE